MRPRVAMLVALVKDLLLIQQYLLAGGNSPANRWLPGLKMRQEAYQNVRGLATRSAKSPKTRAATSATW
jgi:hypothetical protein